MSVGLGREVDLEKTELTEPLMVELLIDLLCSVKKSGNARNMLYIVVILVYAATPLTYLLETDTTI
jgi:hypothetical protein